MFTLIKKNSDKCGEFLVNIVLQFLDSIGLIIQLFDLMNRTINSINRILLILVDLKLIFTKTCFYVLKNLIFPGIYIFSPIFFSKNTENSVIRKNTEFFLAFFFSKLKDFSGIFSFLKMVLA